MPSKTLDPYCSACAATWIFASSHGTNLPSNQIRSDAFMRSPSRVQIHRCRPHPQRTKAASVEHLVEQKGIEPSTSRTPSGRSPGELLPHAHSQYTDYIGVLRRASRRLVCDEHPPSRELEQDC